MTPPVVGGRRWGGGYRHWVAKFKCSAVDVAQVLAQASVATGWVAWITTGSSFPLAARVVVVILTAIFIVLLIRRERQWVHRFGPRHISADSGANGARPGSAKRPWSQVPRAQRVRLAVVVASAGILVLLLAPLLVLSLVTGRGRAESVPPFVILLLAIAGVAFTWRQMRRPGNRMLAVEDIRRHTEPWPRVLGLLLVIPALAASGWIYERLESSSILAALGATAAANLVVAVFALAIDLRVERQLAASRT